MKNPNYSGRGEPTRNKVELIGRVHSEIERKWSKGETASTSFTITVERDSGPDLDYLRVVAFADLAEKAVRLTKGSQIRVVGKLQSRLYQATGGKKQTVVEVIAESLEEQRGGGREEDRN